MVTAVNRAASQADRTLRVLRQLQSREETLEPGTLVDVTA